MADGLARLDQSQKLDAIAQHRQRAETLEREEQWAQALDEFEAVLALDPTIVFAQRGAARTSRRAELVRRIEHHLDHPDRMSDDDVLAEAEMLWIEASEIQPAGPRHDEAVARLADLIAKASTYVRVRLRSDGMTEVVVYRVGRLGTFETRELELRPGRYTVVGSRSGYRDVRHELVVTADGEPAPLTVMCEEPI